MNSLRLLREWLIEALTCRKRIRSLRASLDDANERNAMLSKSKAEQDQKIRYIKEKLNI